MAYFCHLSCNPPVLATLESPRIHKLLDQFESTFKEPTKLPPSRATDHRFTLVARAQPVNVNPYKYPHFQKNEIERLTREMLQHGLIHPSISPFSSPMLLVRKKDSSWHFCINYRSLNVVIVRDQFPIPTMDELIDELHGAHIFSKINLRVGYHQIRIRDEEF